MEETIQTKTFAFAIIIVKLSKVLMIDRKEFVMSKQLLKSGTSIGANVREAQNAESKADFIHKMAIAQKEADETIYWLDLLNATSILKIIRTIIIRSKANNKALN